MNFRKATRAPVSITIVSTDGSELVVEMPRMRFDDWVALGAKVDAARSDDATRGMTLDLRYKYLSLYPVQPSTVEDLKETVRAPLNSWFIVRRCLERSPQCPPANGQEAERRRWIGEVLAAIEDGIEDVDQVADLAEALSRPRSEEIPPNPPNPSPAQQQQQAAATVAATQLQRQADLFDKANTSATFAEEGPPKGRVVVDPRPGGDPLAGASNG